MSLRPTIFAAFAGKFPGDDYIDARHSRPPAGDLLDVYVNGRLVARGEAVIVGDQLGLRIVEVTSRAERLSSQR